MSNKRRKARFLTKGGPALRPSSPEDMQKIKELMARLSACYLSEPEPEPETEPKRSPLFIDDAGRERIAKSFQAALEETADVIEAFRLNYLAQPDD